MPQTASLLSLHWYSVKINSEVEVVDRADLINDADVTVPVGIAPDGLPTALSVRRSASVVEPILRALGAGHINGVSADIKRRVLDLDERVQHERRALGVIGPQSTRPTYVTASSVDQLFGSTLCMRLLGAMSPLLMPNERYSTHSYSNAVKTSAGVLMNPSELAEMRRVLDHAQRLAVPLDDSASFVVRHPRNRAVNEGDLREGRPVVWEDLRTLKSTQFHTYRRVEGEDQVAHFQGKIGDSVSYAKALAEADGVAWSVSRQDLARVVLDAARSLIPLHEDDLVHGDIKPANLFIANGGAFAHDSLQLSAGSIAAVGTKGWNAPEQIMARPVSPSTDVFALAQLLVLLLDAAVFGDERSFIVPVGGSERIRENFLPEPDVFIDPARVAIDDEAREAWRGFLRSCLQLDPRRRPVDASSFARLLEELMARAPLPGRKAVTGLVGTLHCPRVRKGENPKPLWLLHDTPRS